MRSPRAAGSCPERDGAFANGGREPEFEEKQRPFLDFYVKQLESCPGLRGVCELIRKVARTGATVVIQGETGVGKEVMANYVHRHSGCKGPFVAVHPASVSEHLFENEFFGHEKGAFTGATGQKIGFFELADNGTLFIDEVGDIPMNMQIKLLRVLQEHRFMRVGGTKEIHSSFRLIAATNRDLPRAVREGTFREDLYYRISVIPVTIPPLRERKADIGYLAGIFLDRLSQASGQGAPEISGPALKAMQDYAWPGNIRELENVCERAWLLSGGAAITKAASMKFYGKTFDAKCADGKGLFDTAHPSKMGKATQCNQFSDAFSVDALSAVETEMQGFMGDNGEILDVAPDTILIPNDYQLKRDVFAAVGADKDPDTSNNGFNYQFGRWKIIVWPYLNQFITKGTKPWVLGDSRYNEEYGSAVWLDRVQLEVRSELAGNDANVWKGYARFIAGFNDWRGFAVGGVSGGTELTGAA